MTTATDPWHNPALAERPFRSRTADRLGAAWKKARAAVAKRAKTAAAAIPDRFTLTQLAGSASAIGGAYVLWGLGVMLFAGGLSVVAASVVVERQR